MEVPRVCLKMLDQGAASSHTGGSGRSGNSQRSNSKCGNGCSTRSSKERANETARAWRLGGCRSFALTFLLLLVVEQQKQSVAAIVCEVDARDGLEAATASAAAAAADRQQLLHLLPLCRVPYLVNSQLPPKDVPHIGMEQGATVKIDLQLLPSDYKNNMPARSPRHARRSQVFSSPREALVIDPGYAAYKEQRQRQQQQQEHQQLSFRQAEVKARESGSSAHNGHPESPPTANLLRMDAAEGPFAALASTFPLLVRAGRRLSYALSPFKQAQQQQHQLQQQQHTQQQEQQQWLVGAISTLSNAARGGFQVLINNFVGSNQRGSSLLLSSLSSSLPSPPVAETSAAAAATAAAAAGNAAAAEARATAEAEAAAETAFDEWGPRIGRTARRQAGFGKHFQRSPNGSFEWEGSSSPSASVRHLSLADEGTDGLVHSVNNTILLLLDHAQLYFLETHESWLPSFTAEDGLVLNTYMPSMLRLPFSGPRLQATVTLPYTDRFALVLLNADGLNLKLQGSVSFWGPSQKHLSLEQKHLPETVAFLMFLNIGAACLLGALLVTKWNGRNAFICSLFILNFSLAALAFGLDWRQALVVQETGRRPAALWVASRLMRKLQDVSQLLLFIFVSLGLHVVRQRLSRLEVQFIAGLSVISLYLGAFEVLLGGFQETRYIFHAAGYVRVLIAVHSNIVLLHNQIADSTLSPAVGALYPKLAAYQRFRWIFFAFLLKPVFSVFFKVTFLGPVYEQLLCWDEWIYVLFENGTDFAVIAALCWDFCPLRTFKVLQLVNPEAGDTFPDQQQREVMWDD